MNKTDFFMWLRSNQHDKKLSQKEVDAALDLLEYIPMDILVEKVSIIADWETYTSSNTEMVMSKQGMDMLKEFEGYRSKAYKNFKNEPWTIGYGMTYYPTGKPVRRGDVIDEITASEQKLQILNNDFVPAVRRIYADEIQTGFINQNMFDALVSLGYNIGINALANSTVTKRIKKYDKTGAAEAMTWWNKAGGRVVTGLVNRRKKESELFLS